MKCKNCNHELIKGKNMPLVHANRNQGKAFICRVERCNCLKPEARR